jgi:hypothetical protein
VIPFDPKSEGAGWLGSFHIAHPNIVRVASTNLTRAAQ